MQGADLDQVIKARTIGMEHVATALSQLMGQRVNIGVPRLLILDPVGVAVLLDSPEVICMDRDTHLNALGNALNMMLLPSSPFPLSGEAGGVPAPSHGAPDRRQADRHDQYQVL